MGQYLLGIDNGSTVSKAALFDITGKEIAIASCRSETEYPHPGWTERDMESMWYDTTCAIREVLQKSGIASHEIAGIGCTGHGNGVYLLDKQGQPLRNGIQSMDTRAAGILAEWSERDVHTRAFPYVIQSFWPAQPNALLAWLKKHEPGNYENIGAILLCKDYIKYRLTGEVTTDYSDMSGSSLMDVRRKRYSRDLLALYDIEEIFEALPRLVHSFEVAGKVTSEAAAATGLTEGTPVVSGLFDIDSSAVGCGAVSAGQACIIAGTWSINEVITAEPLVDPSLFMTTLFCAPGLFLSTEASATSAANLEWFVNQCCGEEKYEAQKRGVSIWEVINEEVASLPPGSTNIIFHPFLFGSNVQSSARAGFYGLGGWHTRTHMLRALYEGVVFCHLSHIEKLRAAGACFDTARLTGGGSRSPVWTQMFADTIGVPMEVSDGTELGARGAALSAGIGVGLYRDYQEAVDAAVKVVRLQEPNMSHTSLYLERYAEYQRLVKVMQEPWEALNRLDVV
jgi:L-xylulokinase